MNIKLYAIYDSAAKYFGPLFQKGQHGEALRDFTDLCNDERTNVFRHPTDYVLYQIGEMDDQTGLITPITPHLHLGLAADFKKRIQPQIQMPMFEKSRLTMRLPEDMPRAQLIAYAYSLMTQVTDLQFALRNIDDLINKVDKELQK